MRLLLIGASGVLGTRLYNDSIREKIDILGTYSSTECEGLFYLDLQDKKSIEKAFSFFRPEVVVLAGGITDVDLCELKPRVAENVNIKGTLSVIKKVKEYTAKLVFLSTDYIFNGEDGPYKEEDSPSPINVYGRTKLEAEEIIKASLKDYLIVRTCQLYGLDNLKSNFAIKIIFNMRNNKKVYAAADLYSTPTYTGTLSESIIRLISAKHSGIFHIGGRDFIDRYTYVSKISKVFGLKQSLINKVLLKDLHLVARRPLKGGLDTGKAVRFLGSLLIDVNKGLELLRDELYETGNKV